MNDIALIRKGTGLSQSRFAAALGIPVRTLQQWEQGKSSPPSYVTAMIGKLAQDLAPNPAAGAASSTLPRSAQPVDFSRHRIPSRDTWKVCIDRPFQNCERIYPIQQRKVRELLDDITADPAVSKVVVFGSSVTGQCHQGSDVDLFVSSESNRNPLTSAHDFPIDLWMDSTVDERLASEISEKGVVVYG